MQFAATYWVSSVMFWFCKAWINQYKHILSISNKNTKLYPLTIKVAIILKTNNTRGRQCGSKDLMPYFGGGHHCGHLR